MGINVYEIHANVIT